MASWTDIPNSSLETGAPARSVDALAFRDNPIAIAEGATGAPRIQTAAINDDAITAAKLNADVFGANKVGSTVFAHERLNNNTKYSTGTRTVSGSSLYVYGNYISSDYYLDPTIISNSTLGTSPTTSGSGWSEPIGLSGTWVNAQDCQNYSISPNWFYIPTLWIRIA